jgi:hypothetical protein
MLMAIKNASRKKVRQNKPLRSQGSGGIMC